MPDVWCVEWRGDGGRRETCALASQPKGEPVERDIMRTRCRHYVILPGGVELDEPTCPDCRRLLGMEAHDA